MSLPITKGRGADVMRLNAVGYVNRIDVFVYGEHNPFHRPYVNDLLPRNRLSVL